MQPRGLLAAIKKLCPLVSPFGASSGKSPARSLMLLLPLRSHGAITMHHAAASLLSAQPAQLELRQLKLRQLRVQPRQLRMVTSYGSIEDDDGCSVRGLRDGEICWEPVDPLLADKADYFELPLNESWSPLRAASLRIARIRKLVYAALGNPLLLLPAACFSWWLLPVLSNLSFFQLMQGFATQAERESIGSIEGVPRACGARPLLPTSRVACSPLPLTCEPEPVSSPCRRRHLCAEHRAGHPPRHRRERAARPAAEPAPGDLTLRASP